MNVCSSGILMGGITMPNKRLLRAVIRFRSETMRCLWLLATERHLVRGMTAIRRHFARYWGRLAISGSFHRLRLLAASKTMVYLNARLISARFARSAGNVGRQLNSTEQIVQFHAATVFLK